ncbi:2OG-Fe(II) oxygenase family protein [Kitasatospora sp. McL0602]|uniref:2OG-Fe(II) oxygenase family protein n=1 Tax=Kitasatospora sp. McL0602 TaxID=3439530 RepID=UPI003F8C6C6A
MSVAIGAPQEIRAGRIYQDVYEKRSGDSHAAQATAEADLEVGWIADGGLCFPDEAARRRALGDGVFLLRIPAGIDPAIGDRFADGFHRGAGETPYGHFRELGPEQFGDPLLGYHQRINQIEQFLLERRFWQETFPAEVRRLGEELTFLSKKLLRSVLVDVGIPRAQWPLATGQCSEGAGSYHLTFNHYRPQLAEIGLNSHKDDGFLTILRTTSPGLEVSRRDQWERVPVETGCFVVNFGLSMEILTAASACPVAAIMHRVTRQTVDRSSFGHFTSSGCEPGQDHGIYRFRSGSGLQRVCSSRELIDSNDLEIYQGTERPETESR